MLVLLLFSYLPVGALKGLIRTELVSAPCPPPLPPPSFSHFASSNSPPPPFSPSVSLLPFEWNSQQKTHILVIWSLPPTLMEASQTPPKHHPFHSSFDLCFPTPESTGNFANEWNTQQNPHVLAMWLQNKASLQLPKHTPTHSSFDHCKHPSTLLFGGLVMAQKA